MQFKYIVMEESKPTYQEVENELNEYKQLLWQLSDEYKENVTAAEKKVEEELNKRLILEKKINEFKPKSNSSGINSLGLPACILNNNGEIIKFNNKFKFLIELLFIDIEEVKTIQELVTKDKNSSLLKSVSEYLKGDNSLYQSIYTVANSFQGIINLILRIYRNENNKEHLALFVELNKQELDSIKKTASVTSSKTNSNVIEASSTNNEKTELLAEIKSYISKYEISEQLLNFINKKINDKTENISLIREIYSKIEKAFGLKKEGKEILKKITTEHKDFLSRLKQQHKSLTANEVKQCLLIKADLTYKEIAAIMDISVNGVKIARNRLRKKLKLDTEMKTSEFIERI